MKYIYTVWLEDTTLTKGDPDYEWPACFVIDGATEASAKAWGDRLAEKYAAAHDQGVVRSEIEMLDGSALPGLDTLITVQEGHEVTDEEIGW